MQAENHALGNYLEYTASGTLSAGDVIDIGAFAAIVTEDMVSGDVKAVQIKGHVRMRNAAVTGSQGDSVYWDNNGTPVEGTALSGAATTTSASGDFWCGILSEDLAATDVWGYVLLNEFNVAPILEIGDAVSFADDVAISFGTGDDFTFSFDSANMEILPAIDDTGALHVGDGTTDCDVKIFLGTTGEYVLFDMGNSLADFHVPITVGEDNLGHDVKFFGATASSYMLWDESDDRLEFDGADLNLQDSDVLQFGDAQDITMTWNGSKFLIAQATANSAIELGVDGAGIDFKLFGDTASSYCLWDQTADTLILDGSDLSLLDADILKFGDADDITMTWNGTQFVINALTANSAIYIGQDGAGLDVKFFGDTASSYMLWDQTADKLIIAAGTADLGTSCEADAYTVGGVAGIDHGPADITSITVVKGIVTGISSA